MNKEYKFIINCIAVSLGADVNAFDTEGVDFNAVYKYSVSHSITPLVYDGIKKLGVDIPVEVKAKFIKNFRQFATQYVMQDEQLTALTDIFEQKGIRNMPLKGSILRKMYPSPELRTSSDIDILYDEENEKIVAAIFADRGYVVVEIAAKDTSYLFPPFVNVEMHRTLMGDHPELEGDFADVWDRVKLVEGKKYCYEMSNEDFYLYMVSHSAKHYFMGGIGIRFVTDIFVFNRFIKDNIDKASVAKRLDEMGITVFNEKIVALAEHWFNGKEADASVLALGDFICDCDTFGNVENRIANQIVASGSAGFFLKRIFLPYNTMCGYYPSLKGKKVLLPFYWVLRVIKGVFNKNSRLYTETKVKASISEEKFDNIKSLNSALGFDEKNIRY